MFLFIPRHTLHYLVYARVAVATPQNADTTMDTQLSIFFFHNFAKKMEKNNIIIIIKIELKLFFCHRITTAK